MKLLLLCGDDESLLQVRAAVLRKGPFEVTTAAGVAQLVERLLPSSHTLVVLCNSLSYPDRVHAARWVTETLPSLPVITLTRGDDHSTFAFKHPLESTVGPEGLLSLSRQLAVNEPAGSF